MKLRNSFVSLKSLSEELNIPLVCTPKASPTESRKVNVHSLDYEQNRELEEANFHVKNIERIDKPVKSSGLRVRNLKKSMLNDNRLMKLRQRFLKRSKSTATDIGIIKVEDDKISLEENQNKENERPGHTAAASSVSTLDSSPKVHSMNRNKVKMGTRVFSPQFLNKSFDNIYDNPIEISRFDTSSRFDSQQNFLPEEDRMSLKSTSIGSIFFAERAEKLAESRTDAYVIRK